MDLLEFYGLKEDPFKLSPDPAYFFPSVNHKEALSSLDYVVQQQEGFCLISGKPGTGKTTIINVFLGKWKEQAEIALILTPRLSPDEFLMAVLDDLKVSYLNKSKVEILKAFRNFLLEKSKAGTPVIIMVDEAHNLADDTLEELRLLSNLETEKGKLLQIILIGQPELEERLKEGSLSQLNQRITVRVRLQPLASSEVLEYLNYRLAQAGKSMISLDKRIIKPLYRFSSGIPRVINLVASRTIMAAYLEGDKVASRRHIRYAIDHLKGGEGKAGAGKVYRNRSIVVIAALLVSGGILFYLYSPWGISVVDWGINRERTGIRPKAVHVAESGGSQPDGVGEGSSYPPAPAAKVIDTGHGNTVSKNESAKESNGPGNALHPEEQTLPTVEELYKKGKELIDSGKFQDAIKKFALLVETYPKDELADNALYWEGEAYYAIKDYENALIAFEKITREYPAGNKVPDALLKAGVVFGKLGKKKKAEEVFIWLVDTYPNTPFADQGMKKLKELTLSE